MLNKKEKSAYSGYAVLSSSRSMNVSNEMQNKVRSSYNDNYWRTSTNVTQSYKGICSCAAARAAPPLCWSRRPRNPCSCSCFYARSTSGHRRGPFKKQLLVPFLQHQCICSKASQYVAYKSAGHMRYKQETKITFTNKYVNKEQGYKTEYQTQLKCTKSVYPNKSSNSPSNNRINYY